MSRISTFYLLAYNSFQTVGWTLSLIKILYNLIATASINGTYASAGNLICFLQCAAFLEVIHGAIGIVPSGVLLPLMQWGGRTHFVLAIVRNLDELQELPSVFITFLAWSMGEVICLFYYWM
ncbi:very-long-chain (3R)-3-hydroxyacyl-CoA dehydratase 2-like [Vigna umbellata]|uniref:very-long-chain (3R)-3-hydroxyacyl-CoA dehydratase 2-like n=1 Tax=Vigna umbellata TaxID=87088 RepID=UPI001F5EA216|nr:very-long-chain (3R)-3-hydroxyacyl-CoA dehydratase 2-like [Vigna umbellata]